MSMEVLGDERARFGRFVCKEGTGGMVRCTHEDLSITIQASPDDAKIYSRESGMDIEVDHEAENERSWR